MAVALFSVFNSAFAVNPPDSTPIGAKTYAATPVKVTDCTPYGGDPNQDGICAHWKDGTYGPGLHVNFNDSSIGGVTVHYRYDLPCTPGNTLANDPTGYTVCPSTSQKDIYLELDCMTGQCPQPQAIYDVVSAFNAHGIHLHVQMGENASSGSGDIGVHFCDVKRVTTNYDSAGDVCTSTTTNYQSYPDLKQNFFGTVDERAGNTSLCPLNGVPPGYSPSNANSFNCLTAKRQVFHYGMFVDYQISGSDSAGWAEVFGNDLIISLGGFTNGVGSLDEQEGTLMHELGHNLALNHGGVNDANNCKPNYLSVMNYVYMFQESADSCRPLDYSNTALSNLNEGSLSDSNIGSYPYPSGSSCQGERKIFWSSPTGTTLSGTTGVTDDWDNNGIDSNTYSQVLNNVGSSCSASTTPITLTGFNDWAFLANGNSALGFPEPLNFRTSTNFYQTVLPASGLDSDVYTQGDNHEDFPLLHVQSVLVKNQTNGSGQGTGPGNQTNGSGQGTGQVNGEQYTDSDNPYGPLQMIGWGGGLVVAGILTGIGVWTAVRRR